MHLNRNHYFFAGVVILFLGLQFRFVDSFVLNAEASSFIAKRFASKSQAPLAVINDYLPGQTASPLRSVTPPKWLGWALLSLGSVLILHSWAMPKAGGGGDH